MAQIPAAMEVALQGLRGLQERGAAIDPANLEAEAAATEERRYAAEAAANATREAELARREAEAASRVAALDARTQALTDREETAHREAAAEAAAKDRAAEVEREARDHASAAAQDAATKVKEARLLLKGEKQEAAHRVTIAKAVAFDATTRAAATEEKAAHLDAAEGIVQGFEDEARTQTLAVAREVVNTLVPVALAAILPRTIFGASVRL
ncbi:uncharacterized abhydrolase domain-containing protein DDB_G0269086-like [Panicum virgatum]|uniref:uncharacterized abhydrolase domain-containing protein DDB_G0269086-like n=1 Tax=Panicum virgatum TaxID=38727 RepID=UPI0019D62661|nr:uncharacterized abhydrolase domain-containing protein DDB_G0269086-like [Panicum virgatum]